MRLLNLDIVLADTRLCSMCTHHSPILGQNIVIKLKSNKDVVRILSERAYTIFLCWSVIHAYLVWKLFLLEYLLLKVFMHVYLLFEVGFELFILVYWVFELFM